MSFDVVGYKTITVFYKNGNIKEKINRMVRKNEKLGNYILYNGRNKKVEYSKQIGWNFTI